MEVAILVGILGLIVIGLLVYIDHLRNRESKELRKTYIDSGRIMRDKELEANEEETANMPPPSVDDINAELERLRSRRNKR